MPRGTPYAENMGIAKIFLRERFQHGQKFFIPCKRFLFVAEIACSRFARVTFSNAIAVIILLATTQIQYVAIWAINR
jgi:hypothetical protein